jgi:hypothetical protein
LLCSVVHCGGRVAPLLDGVFSGPFSLSFLLQVRERSCTSESLNFSYADCAITIGAQRNEITSVSNDGVY